MAVFASRQIVMPATPIAVTIIGSGNSSNCYAIINGTKQYEAGTHEVYAGDMITFGVSGGLWEYSTVTINGKQVLKAESDQKLTYDWTVPKGISTVEIAMEYSSYGDNFSSITVTTA